MPAVHLFPGLLLDEEEFRVESTVLNHGIPCLAFAFEEKLRVNVWREGLRRLGLPVGPWLREAKRADLVAENQDLRFTPRPGSQQPNERATKQSEQLNHQPRASPDSLQVR